MTGLAFKKAVRKDVLLRLALAGPPGSGKTFSALAIATRLGAGRVALVDTERGSAKKYADRFDFDLLELDRHSPDDYVAAVEAARQAGYRALVIDSWSHAWTGKGGALEMVDESAKRSKSGNTFNAWRDVTPAHNRMVDALLAFPGHLIATLRSKVEYVVENDGRKSVPRKVGMAPIQRDGVEYEFDIFAEMNLDNELVVGKTRCFELREKIFKHPGEDVAAILRPWLAGAPESAEAVGRALSQIEELRALCKARGVDEQTFKRLAKAVKLNQMPHAEAMKLAASAEVAAPPAAEREPSPAPPPAAPKAQPPADPAHPWGFEGEVDEDSHVPRADAPAAEPGQPHTPEAPALRLTPPDQHTTAPAAAYLAESPKPPPARPSPRPAEGLDPVAKRLREHLDVAASFLPEAGRAAFVARWTAPPQHPGHLRQGIDEAWKALKPHAYLAALRSVCDRTGADYAALEAEVKAKRMTRTQAAMMADVGEPKPAPAPAAPAPGEPEADDDPETVASRYVAEAREAGGEGDLDDLAAALREDPRLAGEHRARAERAIAARRVTLEPKAIGGKGGEES